MPEGRLSDARVPRFVQICDLLGYTNDLRTRGFSVWTRGRPLAVDVACFARAEPKDMSTSALIGGVAGSDRRHAELRDAARALAAPAALLERDQRVELWRIGTAASLDQCTHSDVDIEDEPTLLRIRDAISPDAVLDAKQNRVRQLTFLDIDVKLLAHARSEAGDRLERRVRKAISSLSSGVADSDPEEARVVAQKVVQAITALAIRDKLTRTRDIQDALSVLAERFATQLIASRQELEQIATQIGQGVAFDALDAAVLSDLYENVILDKTTRRHLGAYYTPPQLARRILEAIPVEEIEPDRRTILDPACGSGTLLLAASERLAALGPSGAAERHRYVRNLLTGYDRDTFAVELTKLALILNALPQGNGWHVSTRDALAPRTFAEAAPEIVVGNPPWRFAHKDLRVERANAFLKAMVDWCVPGGFVAAIMPASWLTARSARASRRVITTEADLFEIWRLPRTMFKSSDAPPCVVFGRKREPRERRWLYRTVASGHEEAFYSGEDTSFPGVLSTSHEPSSPLVLVPAALGRALAPHARVTDVADVKGGAPSDKASDIGRFGGPYLCLKESRVTPPFGAVNPRNLIACRYPDDFSGRGIGARPDFYLSPKVLVAVTNTVGAVERVRAFNDEVGVIPRNSMVAVVPRRNNEEARLALVAALGSRVANAWLQTTTSRQVMVDAVKQLPLPTPDWWPALASAVRRVQQARFDGVKPELDALEQTVVEAYELDDEAIRDIASVLGDGHDQRQPSGAGEAVAHHLGSLTVGSVLDVRGGKLLLFVAGVTAPQGEWVEPPAAMPGALMRPGATFDAFGTERGLEWARYVPQEMSWVDDDGLFSDSPND